jgi:NADH:ubiquinone oxidoreductase subunit 5 (subunit L)/multisubunit Na+/H+ antiporter MnhA subunit
MLLEKQHLPMTGETGNPSYHLAVPFVSIAFVLIGAIPAYYLYIRRTGDPGGIVVKWSMLKALYQFFWNRWYIDKLYYRLFVDGTIRVSNGVAAHIEDSLDGVYHRAIPTLPKLIYNRLNVLRTESSQLFHNVTYILIFLILFFFILLLGRIK